MGHQHGLPAVGRRGFLANVGGGTVALTILGPALAACGGDDDAAPESTSTSTGAADPTSTTAGDAAGTESPLRFERASYGFVSAYVLVRDGAAVVVDTGTGDVGPIEQALGALGSGFDRIGDVIVTHLHGDHVGGIDVLAEAASSARFHAGEADVAGIDTDIDLRPLADGDEVAGLQIIGTPGHTAGHVSVFDAGSGILVAGDALVVTDGALGGSPPQFTADETAAMASVLALADLDVRTILPGHGDPLEGSAGAALDALVASS